MTFCSMLKGQAAIIPTFPDGTPEVDTCKKGCNEDRPIKYLISAPTMRVPLDVMDTANAYLAFRAIILAGKLTFLKQDLVTYVTIFLWVTFIDCHPWQVLM